MKIYKAGQYPSTVKLPTTEFDLSNIRGILADIRQNGTVAVQKYAREFDGYSKDTFRIPKHKIQDSYDNVSEKFLNAINLAKENIENFAKLQKGSLKEVEMETPYGVLGHKLIPVESVGCYVPGGKYPLPSSALMTVVPAKVAGVDRVILCSPKITAETIVAADVAGADEIYNLGGVQAIGSMAYGTDEIKSVSMIVGPGNKYVTAAKREVYGVVGIDFLAGPSEVAIIADETADPNVVAADLLAQAEHDVLAKGMLLCTSEKIALRVAAEVNSQLSHLKTHAIAKVSANNFEAVVGELDELVRIANNVAPEHLELQVKEGSIDVKTLNNYGSLFIGSFSAEVFGDYCSGPNHTLPTAGAAKYSGGLSVLTFLKISTYQKLNRNLHELISCAETLAEIEGLDAHKHAATIRRSFG